MFKVFVIITVSSYLKRLVLKMPFCFVKHNRNDGYLSIFQCSLSKSDFVWSNTVETQSFLPNVLNTVPYFSHDILSTAAVDKLINVIDVEISTQNITT